MCPASACRLSRVLGAVHFGTPGQPPLWLRHNSGAGLYRELPSCRGWGAG